MKIRINVILLVILSFLACKNKGNNTETQQVLNKKNEKILNNNQDLSNHAEHFVKSILESNLGKITIKPSDLKILNYNQLFNKQGITKIVAYYDKKINQQSQPTKFEDFLLFVASYDSSNNAKKAFERIKSDANLSNSMQNIKIDRKLSDRIKLLSLNLKYGGLITFNDKQVFSLVENCEIFPMGKSWLESEYTFTNLLKNKNGYVEVLKAGCEEGKYYGGKRKARS